MNKLLIALILFCTVAANAATIWTKLGNDNDVITVPTGSVIRYGSGTNWAVVTINSGSFTFSSSNLDGTSGVGEVDIQGIDVTGVIVNNVSLSTANINTPASLTLSTTLWIDVAKEGDTVTIPANTTVRYGNGQTWSATKSFSVLTSLKVSTINFNSTIATSSSNILQARGTLSMPVIKTPVVNCAPTTASTTVTVTCTAK